MTLLGKRSEITELLNELISEYDGKKVPPATAIHKKMQETYPDIKIYLVRALMKEIRERKNPIVKTTLKPVSGRNSTDDNCSIREEVKNFVAKHGQSQSYAEVHRHVQKTVPNANYKTVSRLVKEYSSTA